MIDLDASAAAHVGSRIAPASASGSGVHAAPQRRSWLLPAVAAVALLAIAGLAWAMWPKAQPVGRVTRFEVALPARRPNRRKSILCEGLSRRRQARVHLGWRKRGYLGAGSGVRGRAAAGRNGERDGAVLVARQPLAGLRRGQPIDARRRLRRASAGPLPIDATRSAPVSGPSRARSFSEAPDEDPCRRSRKPAAFPRRSRPWRRANSSILFRRCCRTDGTSFTSGKGRM